MISIILEVYSIKKSNKDLKYICNLEVNLYHQELHKKKVTKLAILELETENGALLGHKDCSEHINFAVANLLKNKINFNNSRKILLNEVEEVFT